MKKILIWSFFTILIGFNILLPVLAQTNNDFEIIPQSESWTQVTQAVTAVGSSGGHVRDIYNQKAKTMEGQVGNQLASGIMTRDTLLDYVVYFVRFLSQIGLVIGGIMIIYAGYAYATEIFGGKAGWGTTAITNAIIGVLVIAFSYAIMKLLTSAFIS